MTTCNCKNMERCCNRGPSANQGAIIGSNDVSCNNSMQIHQVICYCASIRAIPFNRVVGRSKTKHNHRPLPACSDRTGFINGSAWCWQRLHHILTNKGTFICLLKIWKPCYSCCNLQPWRTLISQAKRKCTDLGVRGSMIPEMLTNQYCWQQIFQFASYVLSPCAQACGCSRDRRFIFLMKCWLMEIRRRMCGINLCI